MTRNGVVMTRNVAVITRNGVVITRNGAVITRNGVVITRNGVVTTQYINLTTLSAVTITSGVVAQGCEVLTPTFRESRLRDNDNITRYDQTIKPYLELSNDLPEQVGISTKLLVF
jgi:hypothetical protein